MARRAVILWVDDEKMILDAAKEQLDRFFKKEYNIECVESAEAALELFKDLQKKKIDVPVVICDQIMPGMKGDELLKELHRINPRSKKILLTGQADTEALGRAINSGSLYQYVSKPWDQNDLFAIVKKAINSFYNDKTLEEQNKDLIESLSQLKKLTGYSNKKIPDGILEILNSRDEKNTSIEKELTILYASLDDFKYLSETLSNSEEFKFLEHYLQEVSPLITENNGYIDKFSEGSITALFLKADDALKAAILLQQKVKVYNEKTMSHSSKESVPMILGIGLDTDIITLGTLGEYTGGSQITVLGQALETAQETELKNREFGSKIILTESTFNRITKKGMDFRFIDLSRIKGRELVIPFYEFLDLYPAELKAKKIEIKDLYQRGVIDFRNGLYKEAEETFDKCLKICPVDIPSQYFISACRKSIQEEYKLKGADEALMPSPNLSTYLKFWGTRGSAPVSGNEFAKYGGCTCCLELRTKDDIIIIDVGTGSRLLGEQLLKEKVKKLHLIVSHFHWDHISGFPFFLPIYQKDFSLDIYGPGSLDAIKEQFSLMLSSPYFPVSLKDLQSKITFHSLEVNSSLQIGDINIKVGKAHHPGTTTCFKIKTPTLTIGYATDNEFLLGNYVQPTTIDLKQDMYKDYLEQIEFFQGCDVMIHEAQYVPSAYTKKTGWGHSSTENAALLMKILKPKEWILTHHDPDETDIALNAKRDQVQLLVNEIGCKVSFAEDGLVKSL